MICIVCKFDDLEHPVIVHYYDDYGNEFSHAETYCGFACLREAIH